jgi:cytochrome c5
MRLLDKLSWNSNMLACLFVGLSLSSLSCDDDKSADSGHDAADHDDHDADGGDEPDHDHDSEMVGPVTGAVCPSGGSTLTYDNFGKQFFANYCQHCHASTVKGAARMGAPADHVFDTVDEISLLAPHIDEYAGSGPASTNTHMPPAGNMAPSVADRQKLSEWIACGAN